MEYYKYDISKYTQKWRLRQIKVHPLSILPFLLKPMKLGEKTDHRTKKQVQPQGTPPDEFKKEITQSAYLLNSI